MSQTVRPAAVAAGILLLIVHTAVAQNPQVGISGPLDDENRFDGSRRLLQGFTTGSSAFIVNQAIVTLTSGNSSVLFNGTGFFAVDTGTGNATARVGGTVGSAATVTGVSINDFPGSTEVTFTFSDVTLAANTSYFFGLRNANSLSNQWVITHTPTNIGSDGTVVDGLFQSTNDGATYTGPFANEALVFRLSGTRITGAVPEPSVAVSLVAFSGILGTAVVRKRIAKTAGK